MFRFGKKSTQETDSKYSRKPGPARLGNPAVGIPDFNSDGTVYDPYQVAPPTLAERGESPVDDESRTIEFGKVTDLGQTALGQVTGRAGRRRNDT